MPKKLREYPIYIAPEIQGVLINGTPDVDDERTKSKLYVNNIDDKITIYERQVKEWFLKRASRISSSDKNGFVILMIAISYIEGVEQYRIGKSSNGCSKKYFRNGLRRIFDLDSIPDERLNDFYSQARCGLFHNGMTGGQIIINQDFPKAINFSELEIIIKINPKKFLKQIQLDFDKYLKELKKSGDNDLKTNFNTMYKFD